jgi:2-oxoglutarate dehydrogenase complex dehydrogenase (E1) component-like enzyme
LQRACQYLGGSGD